MRGPIESLSMTKSYADIQKQIAALSREAEKVRRKEIEGVVARIREAIAVYGLTASDLGLSGAKRGPKPKAAAKRARKAGKATSARPAKFRDENGNSWGGRGPRPQWLRTALAGGKKLEDFAI
jgi:DNA-binding protein H-NS